MPPKLDHTKVGRSDGDQYRVKDYDVRDPGLGDKKYTYYSTK